MVGDLSLLDEFLECADMIKKERNVNTIKFPVVLAYLKQKIPNFEYRAIRVWPYPKTLTETGIYFPGERMVLGKAEKIQVCFFDETLLINPYTIVEKNPSANNQTI